MAIDAVRDWPASRPIEVTVDDLQPYSKNARTHSKSQVDQIAKSIEEWGWTSPLLITSDHRIIAGHGRFEAAKQLKLARVPAVVATGWSDNQIRAYVIADNKLALNAGWDEELLAAELSELKEAGFEIDLIGFSQAEFDALVPSSDRLLADVDEVPELSVTPVCQVGDVWALGDHRLICGDATQASNYDNLLKGDLPLCCWTDPPYNVNYGTKAGSIKNDNLGDAEFANFLGSSFCCMANALPAGASVYIAHADTEGFNFRRAFLEAGLKLSGVIIWEKNSLVFGRSDYQWKHEPILYGWKPGKAHRWLGDRKQTTISELNGNVFSMNQDGSLVVRVGDETVVVRGDNLTAQAIEPSIIRADKPTASADHPTMKPVGLISSMLRNSTCRGDIVLDPFAGSGSTLIACQVLELQARVMELDPRYCDVVIERWQNITGGKATR